LSEQTNQKEKKKLIQFKPGIRKEFFKAVIFMAIFMIVMIAAMVPFGQANGLAFGMALMGILMTLSNDYTLEPVKNTCTLVAANVGMVLLSYLGYAFFPAGTVGYTVMMTAVTLVTFFAAIYLFTSEERSSTYMPILLSFSLLLYYPVYGWDLLIRCAIYAGASLLAIGVNFLLHKNKFRKKIQQSLDGAVKSLEKQCLDIKEQAPKEELVKQSVIIDKTLGGIIGAMGTKMSVLSHWQAGHDMMRTLTILKRVNKTITDTYIHGGEEMTDEMYQLLQNMLQSIDQFENDQITEAEISAQFDALIGRMTADVDHSEVLSAVQSEMEDFLQGEVRHEDKGETKRSFGDWLRSKINVYNLVFALKVSILAAAGVCVTSIFNLPMAYMFPLYVGITAQPYIELGTANVKKRIINTLYAVIIILIAFSITQNVWVHLALLVAITLVADMFFQFDFMTMMGTMMSVVLNVVMNPDQLYSYSFYRFAYIALACILVQIVDMFIFPNRIPATLQRQMKASLAINDKLRSVLSSDDCGYDTVHQIIMEKRRANQRLKNTNRYAKSEEMTAYLQAEDEWINRLNMVNHRFREGDYHLGDVRRFVEANESADLELNHRQKNILTSFNEVLEDLSKAEQLALSMGKEKAAA
jgi:hypothetical protein